MTDQAEAERASILEIPSGRNTVKYYLGTAIADSLKPESMVVKLFFLRETMCCC